MKFTNFNMEHNKLQYRMKVVMTHRDHLKIYLENRVGDNDLWTLYNNGKYYIFHKEFLDIDNIMERNPYSLIKEITNFDIDKFRNIYAELFEEYVANAKPRKPYKVSRVFT